MRNLRSPALALVALLFLLGPALARAQAGWPRPDHSFMLAGGPDISNDDVDFYELAFTREIPSWNWSLGERTRLSSRLWVTLGALEKDDTYTAFGTAGPVFYIHRNGHAFLDFGIRVTVLTDSVVGRTDFGGPVQFASHIGVGYWFTSGWEIGLRFQHVSNGRLYEPNPDVNFIVLQAGYSF